MHETPSRPASRSPGRPAALLAALLLAGCAQGASTPPPGEISSGVGEAALSAGMPELALRVAGIVLRDHPRDAPALVLRADALAMLDQPAEARRAYADAVSVAPRDPRAGMGLGRSLIATDPDRAEAAFLAVLAVEPGNVAAMNNLGVARDLAGRHDAAQRSYREAIARGGDADIEANLARSLAMASPATPATAAAPREPQPAAGPALSDTSPAVIPAAPAGPTGSAGTPPPEPIGEPRFQVQLAALGTQAEAEEELSRARTRLPELLGDLPATVNAASLGARRLWRLRVGDFATAAEARDLCGRMRQRGTQCWVP